MIRKLSSLSIDQEKCKKNFFTQTLVPILSIIQNPSNFEQLYQGSKILKSSTNYILELKKKKIQA